MHGSIQEETSIMADPQAQLLASLGVSAETRRRMELEGWECHSLNHNSRSRDVPILLVGSGPKNIADIKRAAKQYDTCVIIATGLKKMFIKTLEKTHTAPLDGGTEYSRMAEILNAQNVGAAKSELELNAYLERAIEAIPVTTEGFENRGLFSTHYLQNRLFGDAPDVDVRALRGASTDVNRLLKALGWEKDSVSGGVARTITTDQGHFSIRETEDGIAPSYAAVSELSGYRWVILTNGTKWRLYTSRVSASSTNYFEINLHDQPSDTVLRYLGVIFGHGSFEGESPRIDLFFDQGKEFATRLEEDLASRIMGQDGVLLNLAKGMLNHNMKAVFDGAELASAKESALKVIYRVWFVAYAESRNLLPVSDERYAGMSLRRLRGELDRHESDSREDSCWQYLQALFVGIRDGSPENNLPQYNGNLFRRDERVDGEPILNRWLVPALRDLLERDGEAVDYASLGVRHLGNILESVMELAIQQAREDIMLLVKGRQVMRVRTSRESNYSYRKNDLYLASKGGLAVRKSTASYYTPDEIVTFLVGRGLEPILKERSSRVAGDVKSYRRDPTPGNRRTCMDRLLDIQVLDPTMGSGHFLVEALNHLTSWATRVLKKHPAHPLHEELERDRRSIMAEQRKKGIALDANLLTHDILLKRKMMKRCIFGVDLNPMAVEIAKLALWLDSFAMGVPLTYMDHHIKAGDSTVGMFLHDLADRKNQSLDDWMPDRKSDRLLEGISSTPDATISQVRQSEEMHRRYVESVAPTRRVLDALAASRIDGSIIPKSSDRRSGPEFVHRFGRYGKREEKAFREARKKVAELAARRGFFHWELEMRDAFTDARRGFDCIVGNPPWDKSKPYDDEFFSQHDPAFRDLSPKTKKNERKEKLLENPGILEAYDQYQNGFWEKNTFYKTYEMQGVGDKELSKLVLETALGLVTEGGTISMVMPSQILSSAGSGDIRKALLKKDIRQLYVFENRKKIFPIDSRYRFMLLTLKNAKGGDGFPVGFYLHSLESLNNGEEEKGKFGKCSKKRIREMFPESLVIPESKGEHGAILSKIYQHPKLEDSLGNGLTVSFSSGFHKTNDASLLKKSHTGWPVHEGKTVHQYNHRWQPHEFTAGSRKGLKRESTKRAYQKKHVEFYDSCRLVFRDVSSPTNMRTVVTTIIPPHTFHTNSLSSFVLAKNGVITLDDNYLKNILYLCGVMNSLTFDFAVRANIQMHLAAIIRSLPIPDTTTHKDEIVTHVARMLVGTPEFAGLAERMRIENSPPPPPDRESDRHSS